MAKKIEWNLDAAPAGKGLVGVYCASCDALIERGDMLVYCDVFDCTGELDYVELHHQACVSKDVDAAVAERFEALKPTLAERGDNLPGGEGYVYGSCRTKPDRLGWRFRQTTGGKLGSCGAFPAADILAGKADAEIEATWHDAADAEYHYLYEKDYGRED